MILLGIDTALGACSAAVTRDGQVLAARAEPMMRGHQERLAPLVGEVMAEAGRVIDADTRLLNTRDARAQAQTQAARAAIASFKALGGGWSGAGTAI